MTFTHFDQSTWLAHRAIDAETLPPPSTPAHVALPGAKMALGHDYLLAYQGQGHGEHAIVERVNERYHRANAERTAGHARWVAGPYQGAIEEMRQRAAEDAAKQLRIRATFERIVQEREGQADAGDA